MVGLNIWAGTQILDTEFSGQDLPLVNPGSMTGDDGEANVMFAVWEPFIGHTVKVYCGYEGENNECGVQFLDSLSIKIVNEE